MNILNIFFQKVRVQDLIYKAYTNFGFISTGVIEKLRLKHRLKVVQDLEANFENNAIRSVAADGYLTSQELQVCDQLIWKLNFKIIDFIFRAFSI